MLKIVDIRQRPELLQSAVQYFWKQWGTETNLDFYRDCIETVHGNRQRGAAFLCDAGRRADRGRICFVAE